MKNEQEDTLWISRVVNGDTEAFGLLVDKYKDLVFTLALNMIHQREEAEEVAQDVFMKIFKALPKFKQKAKFSTWMYRIAYNECISRLRKKKNFVISMENLPGGTLPSMKEEHEESGRMRKCVQKYFIRLCASCLKKNVAWSIYTILKTRPLKKWQRLQGFLFPA